jgi:hypothetical protein
MKESTHFRDLCKQHTHFSPLQTGFHSGWQEKHRTAWNNPRLPERAIRDMILAFATMCDAYRFPDYEPGDRELGQDGYFHEHATDMVKAIRAYLNFDCGRFDCGTLDRLICRLAEDAGVEIDE